MAAATFDTLASRVKGGLKAIQDYFFRFQEDYAVTGALYPMNDIASVLSTGVDEVGDITRLTIKLPAGTYVHDWRGTPSDMDSGAGLVYDVVAVREDNTVVLTLVTGSTKAQAASGSDRITDAASHRYVGECYIAMKVTTQAAGALAGTYKWGGIFSIGTLKPTKTPRGPWILEAEV